MFSRILDSTFIFVEASKMSQPANHKRRDELGPVGAAAQLQCDTFLFFSSLVSELLVAVVGVWR